MEKPNGRSWLHIAKDGFFLVGIVWASASTNAEFRQLKTVVTNLVDDEELMAEKHEVADVTDRLEKKIKLINKNTEDIIELRVWLSAHYGIVVP